MAESEKTNLKASTERGGIMSVDEEILGEGVQEGFIIDPKKEKKLLAKLDLFFVPIIMMVYLTCFLDRSNIGNVKVAGMPEDIHASNGQFSVAVSIFYATYVLSETPWAVLLKKLTPRFLLTGLAVVWSLVTIFSGFIENIGGLYTVRLMLGACEGGLFPGLNLYLTMVYRREEQAKRVSYLFVCTAISGAFGGLLAFAILHMDGVSGVAGWRWVYIIEGICSIIVAAFVFFGLPNDPSNAYFLTPEDKQLMKQREVQRRKYMGSGEFSWEEIRIALKDPKVYLSGAIQFCQDILLYGFSTFLPSIIKGMGFGTLATQYLTIPVYIFGGGMFVAFAFVSDKLHLRAPFVLLANIFGIIGYILLLCDVPVGVHYFATFLCAVAVYSGPGLNLTWLNTIGNIAGVVAGQIYRNTPFTLGNSFSLGAICISQFIVLAKMWYIRSCNRKKELIAKGELDDSRKVKTGDWELDFKYHL